MTGIVGPSGSGKSTLMHILAGLDRPTSGTVQIDGVEITDLDDKHLTELRRDKLGFVFQFFNLVPVLTAEENITLPVRIAGRDVDTAWLDSLLDTVGITDRRTHRPSELSGGQQQRVAIARALDVQAGRRVRRRADRQPGLQVRERRARPASQVGRRLRPDGRDGDARSASRLLRGPRRGPRPTGWSCTTGACSRRTRCCSSCRPCSEPCSRWRFEDCAPASSARC